MWTPRYAFSTVITPLKTADSQFLHPAISGLIKCHFLTHTACIPHFTSSATASAATSPRDVSHFCKSRPSKVKGYERPQQRLSHLRVRASNETLKLSYNLWTFCHGVIKTRRYFSRLFQMFGGRSGSSQGIEARHAAFPIARCQDPACGSPPQTLIFSSCREFPHQCSGLRNPLRYMSLSRLIANNRLDTLTLRICPSFTAGEGRPQSLDRVSV